MLRLTGEYLAWVEQRLRAHIDPAAHIGAEAVAGMVDRLGGLPIEEGGIWLVEQGGQLAGTGALRPIAAATVEFKRIYVRPAFRGRRLGQALMHALIHEAASRGYRQAVLDTAPFMPEARRLYVAAGFHEAAPYAGTEVPAAWQGRWCFMTRSLRLETG